MQALLNKSPCCDPLLDSIHVFVSSINNLGAWIVDDSNGVFKNKTRTVESRLCQT